MKHWIILFGLLAACSQEQKKPAAQQARAPEPIPSDFEVNSFLANGPGGSIRVKGDGGAPALPVEAGGAADTESAQAANAADAPQQAGAADDGTPTKLLEPGDAPRAVRKYDLKPGRTDTVTVTLSQTLSQQAPGAPAQSGSQPPMVFTMALTPQPKDAATGETEIKVTFTKVAIVPGPDVPPQQAKQMSQMFQGIAGQTGSLRITSRGSVAAMSLTNERFARSELAPVVQQVFDGLFVVLPAEPIGKGARWQQTTVMRQEGLSANVTTTFTLKEAGPDGLVLAGSTTRKAAPQPLADPRAPRGTTVAVDGTGTTDVTVRLDRMPLKGTTESQTTVTISQPGPGGKPQQVVQKVGVKQSFESAGR